MLQLVQNGIERSFGGLERATAEVLQRLDQALSSSASEAGPSAKYVGDLANSVVTASRRLLKRGVR